MSNADSSTPAKSSHIAANGFSALPEVDTRNAKDSEGKQVRTGDGKEVVSRDDGGLEVTGSDGKELVQDSTHYGDDATYRASDRDEPGTSGAEGRRRRVWWIMGGVVALVIMGIALGVGLGIGLQSDHQRAGSTQSATSSNATEGSPAALGLSTRGAFNGSGISLRRQDDLQNLTSGESVQSNDDALHLLLAFQHHSGDVRWMQRISSDTWQGGSESESITTWAKNGTPLSILATETTADSKTEWHLFYVGKNNKLRQQTMDNETFTWHPGLLDDLSIATLDADKRGLVTCYYSGPIDDPSYQSSGDSGIRLFVATSETTFEQISWQPGMPSWVVEQQWTGFNGHAQPACNGWSPGSVTYAMFVDQDDQVAFYWRDHGDGDTDDPNHPMNTWVKASLNIPAVDPTAGLSYGYGGNLFARTSNNGPVLGWNITFDAESTSISGSSLSQVSGDGSTPNSSLVSWSVPSGDGESELLVFYQTAGDDITVFSGDIDSGDWSSMRLPIPDD